MKNSYKTAKTVGCLCLLILAAPLAASATQGGGSLENGRAAYEISCAVCHGAGGKGDIPGVPDFTKKGSSLSKSDQELFQNILNGYQSPGSFMEMPPKGGNQDLSEQDIRDIILYLREEFGKKP